MLVGLLLAAAAGGPGPNQAASSSAAEARIGHHRAAARADISDAPAPRSGGGPPLPSPAAYPPDPWRLHATIPPGGHYLVAGTPSTMTTYTSLAEVTARTYLDEVWQL